MLRNGFVAIAHSDVVPEGVLAPIRDDGVGDYDAANFMSLMASKFCTPPPTRFVV